MIRREKAYLVAHLDTTKDPPVLKGFATYSSSADNVTKMGRKEMLLDVMHTEVSGKDVYYGDAKKDLVNYLKSPQCHLRHTGPAVERMLEDLLDREDEDRKKWKTEQQMVADPDE